MGMPVCSQITLPKVPLGCAHSSDPPPPLVVIAHVSIVIRLDNLLLATFVIATCHSDLKAGVANLNLACLLLATPVIAACYSDLKPGGPPEGFPTTFGPNTQKGPHSSPPGPKGTPKITSKCQDMLKRNPPKGQGRILNITYQKPQ